MITKGIITAIDFKGNTCTVRMPLFENVSNDQITGTAIISNTPGSYNGYKVDDVVLVGFEDGQMDKPIILGKLYLGVDKEKADPRGVINVENSTTAKAAILPADTKLANQVDKNMANTAAPYGSLSSLANNLSTLNRDVDQLSVFTHNQFKNIIKEIDSSGSDLITRIEQNARKIELEAQQIWPDGDTTQTSRITQNAANINAKVDKTSEGGSQGFGWNLTQDDWTVFVADDTHTWLKDIGILHVDATGVQVAGSFKIVDYPKKNIVAYFGSNDPKDMDITNYVDEDNTENNGTNKLPLGGVENAEADFIKLRTYWGYSGPNAEGDYYIDATHSSKDDSYNIIWRLACDISYKPRLRAGTGVDDIPAKYDLIEIINNITYELEKNSTTDGLPILPPNGRWPGGNGDRLSDVANSKSTSFYSSKEPFKRSTVEQMPDYNEDYYEAGEAGYELYGQYKWAKYLKVGDCWFNTSNNFIKVNTPTNRDGYNAKFIKDASNNYIQVTVETPNITPGVTECYANHHTLLQCISIETNDPDSPTYGKATWEDIGGELVANKITANYINAMDITAKKISIYKNGNTANPILFEADGITSNTVNIANFSVGNDLTGTGGNQTGGPHIKYNALGDTNFVLVSPGYKSKTTIGGSPAGTEKEWAFVAGKNFGVTTNGELFASNLTISGYATNQDLEDAKTEIEDEIPSDSDIGDIAETTITRTSVTAQNLVVKAAHIDGTLTANQINADGLLVNKLLVKDGTDDTAKTLLDAGATSATAVQIGGFNVSGNGLASDSFSVQNAFNYQYPTASNYAYWLEDTEDLPDLIDLGRRYFRGLDFERTSDDFGVTGGDDYKTDSFEETNQYYWSTNGTYDAYKHNASHYSSGGRYGVVTSDTITPEYVYFVKRLRIIHSATTLKIYLKVHSSTSDFASTDYIMSSKVNASAWPRSNNDSNCYGWTNCTNPSNTALTWTKKTITYNNVKSGDYIYIAYRKKNNGSSYDAYNTISTGSYAKPYGGTAAWGLDKSIFGNRDILVAGEHFKVDEFGGVRIGYGDKITLDNEGQIKATSLILNYGTSNSYTPIINIPATQGHTIKAMWSGRIYVTAKTWNTVWMPDAAKKFGKVIGMYVVQHMNYTDSISSIKTQNLATHYGLPSTIDNTGMAGIIGNNTDNSFYVDFLMLIGTLQTEAPTKNNEGNGVLWESSFLYWYDPGCFEPGTKITMGDGSLKNIEDIKSGDMVLSYDYRNSGEMSPKIVIELLKKNVKIGLVNLILDDGRMVQTTTTHTFLSTNGWKSLNPDYAYQEIALHDPVCPGVTLLEIGDYLLTDDGVHQLTDIIYTEVNSAEEHYMYNLNIAEFDTFIANGFINHNSK